MSQCCQMMGTLILYGISSGFLPAPILPTPQLRADTPVQVSWDVLLKGGRVVDGTGAPWYRADVGIKDGKIQAIGNLDASRAKTTLDVSGLIVAPGFIDMMGQTATPMLREPATALNLLTQGITTINAGEGGSAAPVSQRDAQQLGWQNMAEYFQLLDLKGLPVNVVQTIGHTQVRRLVMGEQDRRPSPDELQQMQAHVREAMRAGAIGVSTALIYPPAVYADTNEIAALVSVAAESGGRYYTHMRNEGDRLLEAIEEALQIGQQAGAGVHIYHLKAAGQANWAKMPQAIARIRAQRAAGHQVTADIYPYINNGLGIDALIHPEHFAQGRAAFLTKLKTDTELQARVRKQIESTGGWENWYRHAGSDWNRIIIGQANDPRYRQYAGQSLAAIAKATGESPWETFFGLCTSGAFALPQTMRESNKILAMQQNFVSFCTDVGPAGGSRSASHPRAFGAFPRVFARYVRELGAISVERAVAQSSATAANAIQAYDRGRIAIGQAADVIAFDPDTLTDRANFAEPHAVATGMQHVLVGGELVLRDGKLTDRRPGRVLRGPGYDPQQAPGNRVTGESHPAFAKVERILQGFMNRHGIPGASLAISNNGRPVYARGFGYADVGQRQPVTPDSLFRIASISKPITAVAILQLVDQGKLSLDDRVFDVLDYEPHLAADAKYDPRHKDITIRHLLQHRGGWDRGVSFDAMFKSTEFSRSLGVTPPASPDTVIRVMLGKTLDFDPGQRYAYSNYGYCLLGRVIEKITDTDYETYVQRNVLAPIGVTEMRIGATRLDGRADGEVRYYDPRQGPSVFDKDLGTMVPQAYGAWHLEAMDSHGAWIASAADLVRFASAFDDPEQCPILKPESVREMWQRPAGLAGHDEQGQPKSRYYGLGWSIQTAEDGTHTASHGGSLPGTNTLLRRRADGHNFAILFNTRLAGHLTRVVNAVLPDLTAAIDAIEDWPE